jgi:hypothetical protein
MNVKLTFVSLGSLLLLSSFLSQQFVFEKWNARSARIREANTDFMTYQSQNAVFNALYEIAREDRRERIRQLQLNNYQWALQYLWAEIGADAKAALAKKGVHQKAALAMPSAPTPDTIMQRIAEVQAQIGSLQGEFRAEQNRIDQNKLRANLLFAALYIAGSALVIIGNLVPNPKDRSSQASHISF